MSSAYSPVLFSFMGQGCHCKETAEGFAKIELQSDLESASQSSQLTVNRFS